MEGQRGRSFVRVKMKRLLEVYGESAVETPDGKGRKK